MFKHKKFDEMKKPTGVKVLGVLAGCLLLAGILSLPCQLSDGFGQAQAQEKQMEGVGSHQANPEFGQLLTTMVQPVGKALYVWGGGWNEEDTGSGPESVQIGLPASWQAFMADKEADYDFQDYTYQIHDGLDCSGFIGWGIYNSLNTRPNQEGYVTHSSTYGALLAQKGWGRIIPRDKVVDYKPGDILYNETHVVMVLAAFEDGSYMMVHSAPPSGVQISGSPDANGNLESQAQAKAKELMEVHYPDFVSRFPAAPMDYSFLTDYDQFRWNESRFSDTAAVQNMTPEQIVELLYPSVRAASSQKTS